MPQTRTRVVIDCDPGRDDALAILAALGSPSIQIDLISTVAGNVSLERATSNALGILAVAGIADVPVYCGAAGPLERPLVPGSTLHGDMGEAEPGLPAPLAPAAGSAHEALRQWCRESSSIPKRLVAIGPLTNVGRLLAEDAGALAGVDEIYVMGGTVGQIPTRASSTAEFNFHSDPEAAALVLGSGVAVRLYDYDVTTSCQLPVASIEDIARRIGSPVGEFVGGWLHHLWEYANRAYGREGIAVHDLYALAGAARFGPARWDWYSMTIGLGDDDRGTIYSRPVEPGKGIAVARGLEPEEMIDFLVSSARNLSASGLR